MGFFLGYVFITCSEDTLKIANVLNKLNVPYLAPCCLFYLELFHVFYRFMFKKLEFVGAS